MSQGFGAKFDVAQRAYDSRMPEPEERLGMAWWNGLSRHERITVLIQAGEHCADPSVADAWQMWREGLISTEPRETPNAQAHTPAP